MYHLVASCPLLKKREGNLESFEQVFAKTKVGDVFVWNGASYMVHITECGRRFVIAVQLAA